MPRPKVLLPEEDLGPVRAHLITWRSSRACVRAPIPAEVWAGAVALAEKHGICPVARALGLDYGALKSRVGRSEAGPGTPRPAFLELSPSRTFPQGATTTIEITAPDGARMSIHLDAGRDGEAAGIVTAFLRGRG
jgi:hypothetical protein